MTGGITSNFTKGDTFSSLITSALDRSLIIRCPFLHPLKERPPLFPFSLTKKRIYLDINVKKEFTYLF